MHLYIPSRGRAARQFTLKGLPPALQRKTTLVVAAAEQSDYAPVAKDYGCALMTHNCGSLGEIRQLILDTHPATPRNSKLVMLDDDLRFDARRMDELGKFVVATPQQVAELFTLIEQELDSFIHVGVLSREGGNRITEPRVYNTRMQRVLAYRVPALRKQNIRYANLRVMEDFDFTLQLLRAGCANSVISNFVQGQGSSNAAGGCSEYRTMQVQQEGAEELHRRHPEFVKLVRKQTKTAWGGQERTDVIVSWKRAYDSSRR